MDFYTLAPVWDDKVCRGTSKFATPKNKKMVHNETVIKVQGAMYRDSIFDGIFLLNKAVKLPLPKEGKKRVSVYCCWFGHKLPSVNRSPQFLVDLSKTEVIHDYTGEVFTDLNKVVTY